MNLQEILEAITIAARQIGAEKVLLSRFDVASTPGIRIASCDDPFIDRLYPSLPNQVEVEEPMFYAADAVAAGWAIFIAGGSVNFKDLSEWAKKEADHV
jgi:hypothetical protein